MRKVHLLDTTVASRNIGDVVILEAILPHLEPFLADAFVTNSSTHDGLGRIGRISLASSELAVFTGTNALSDSFFRSRRQWPVGPRDIGPLGGKVVLFGVGAQRRSKWVSPVQKRFLRTVLSTNHVHSVRDAAAQSILEQCGIRSVNTSCPTLWDWKNWPNQPSERAETVCFSLTAYNPHKMDRFLVETLAARYKRLAFWVQMEADLPYLRSLTDIDEIEVLPNLSAYTGFLDRERPDVVGTRLHGTIRAMSRGCRGIVISIDNRAEGIAADTHLPVIQRDELDQKLENWLDDWPQLQIDLPTAAIDTFTTQFQST